MFVEDGVSDLVRWTPVGSGVLVSLAFMRWNHERERYLLCLIQRSNIEPKVGIHVDMPRVRLRSLNARKR